MRSNQHGARKRRVCRAAARSCLVWVGLATGCGPHEPALVNPGMSDVHPTETPPSVQHQDAGVRWEGFAELASYHRQGKPFVSRGHFAGRWNAEVLVNDRGASVYPDLIQSSRFAVGSVLVKKHSDRSSGAPGPIFVMIKRDPGSFPAGGDWEYVVTDPSGWITDRGSLTVCARCHAEAKGDWAFGLPKDAR